MAYEMMTYEVILERMIDRVVEQYPNLDTREGSILYNALAPAAVELAIMYTELDNILVESFVETASREYLLLGCSQMGMDISVFNATGGVHKAYFDTKVSVGSRWNCGLYNYEVIEYIEQDDNGYNYQMRCETLGGEPNKVTGSLSPIDEAPSSLRVAELIECLIEGEDETDDDAIRTAYYEFVNSTATDGNVNQYKRWCDNYEGIGNSKIIPLWNGANTVKVSILSASNRAASEELIAKFQEYLDPNVTGMGDGEAPIGAFVTVTTATEVPIDVSATVIMKAGYTDTTPINDALTRYFASIAYEKSMVAYMNIGAAIIAVEGVDIVSDLTVNGGTADIILDTEQIPILGTTNWG